jgi:hypothetical protein
VILWLLAAMPDHGESIFFSLPFSLFLSLSLFEEKTKSMQNTAKQDLKAPGLSWTYQESQTWNL